MIWEKANQLKESAELGAIGVLAEISAMLANDDFRSDPGAAVLLAHAAKACLGPGQFERWLTAQFMEGSEDARLNLTFAVSDGTVGDRQMLEFFRMADGQIHVQHSLLGAAAKLTDQNRFDSEVLKLMAKTIGAYSDVRHQERLERFLRKIASLY